jgi:single-strand DNA-binding protein
MNCEIAINCPQVMDNSGAISTGGEFAGAEQRAVVHGERAPAGSAAGPRKTRSTRKELAVMTMDNQITLRGFVTAEPKFRQTAQMAYPVTEIRVGSTPRRLNRETGEWQDLPTTYYTVKCWRRLAINTSGSLHKGDMVVVRGRFYAREWLDSEQRPRVAVEIEADSVGHDLAYGWSHFLRGARPQAADRTALDAGEEARQDLESPAGGDAGEGGDRGDGAGGEYPVAAGWPEAADASGVPAGGGDVPGPEEMPDESAGAAEADQPDPELVPF